VEPGTITVRGTATAPGRPDDLRIGLSLTTLTHSPEDALDDVSRRSERLRSLLDAAGVPAGDRSTSAITLGEVREWDGNRQVSRGYRASLTTAVRLTDAAALGPLLARAVAEVEPEVSGPTWQLAPDNPARLEACRLAVADARRRAQAFVEALGAGLGTVVAAAEAGTGLDGFDRPMMMKGSGPAVEAGDIDVTASVDVVFRLEI
jgi:uncharacterized protein YggE